MKTAFVGAVESSEVALSALARSGMPPDLVITLPAGLGRRHADFADLSSFAARIHQTENINAPATRAILENLAPDIVFVIGWSQICGPEFLAIPKRGTIGFHPAPLPRFRGRAVIPWTILTGQTETGATFFWLDQGCDSGDIIAQEIFPVRPDETARTLYDKHLESMRRMLGEIALNLRAGDLVRRPQDHSLASYCARRWPADGRIDWSRPAVEILRLIRAVGDPYPGARTRADDRDLVILSARLHPDPTRFIGLPGQIQAAGASEFVVLGGDLLPILVSDWALNGERRKILKNHCKLG